jgi:hypothetical protein
MYRQAFQLLRFPLIVSGTGSTAYAYTRYRPVNIVWDLDHTLVHTIRDSDKCMNHGVPRDVNLIHPDFVMDTPDPTVKRYAYMRPGAYYVVKFFSLLGANQYVFTAATKSYANVIVKESGIETMILQTLAREDVPIQEDRLSRKYKHTSSAQLATIRACGKDITMFKCDPARTILVDDKEYCHQTHETRGILIPVYDARKKLHDDTLLGVAWIIFKCFFTENIEDAINASEYSVKNSKNGCSKEC